MAQDCGLSVVFYFLTVPILTPRSEPGAISVIGLLMLWRRTVLTFVLYISALHFRPAPLFWECGGSMVFKSDHILAPPPPFFAGGVAVAISDWRFSVPLRKGLPCFSLFLPFVCGFVASPFGGVRVGFDQPHLQLML